jgi:uncharacterized protein (DUF1697 family)
VTVFVSMLRAVNVGGHSQIKMEALEEAYVALGLGDVRTLLQSGNVVFSSRLKDRGALAKRIMQEIERRFDLHVEVVIRTLDEVRTIVQRGPALSPRADRSKLLVMFLQGVPDAQGAAALVKQHKGPEMIEIRGPEIYLYYPDGVGKSKLSAAFIENKVKVAGTARNWNTITKLVEAGDAIERE